MIQIISVVSLVLLVTCVTPALAETWTGYLIDRECAQTYSASSSPQKLAREHARACTHISSASNQEYRVLSNERWLKLDNRGNEIAQGIVSQSIKKNGILVTVTGTSSNDTIEVEKMVELVDTPR